ncbi:MAG: glycosyltransferase family 9 protein [Crocinitomicaceae bacterium]
MKKILVIRFSSIGDIVLTSPVVRCLKKQTNAEIHFLTKEKYASLVRTNPHIDKVITIEKDIHEVADLLKKEHYDFIVDLHHNLRTLRTKRKLNIPSQSFPKLNVQKWLLVQFKINYLPKKHVVDRYFEATTKLSIKNDGLGLDYFIPKKDEVNIATFLPKSFQTYATIALGAQFATKRLPKSQLEKLIAGLPFPIVLLGGKEDQELGDELAKKFPETVFNAAGICSLNQSASIVKQSKFIITHDTGLMHIASAFKIPILSVWGNTVPDFGMSPYLPVEGSQLFEVNNLPCRPCSKIGFQECPKKHFNCMMLQDIPAIITAAKKLFS